MLAATPQGAERYHFDLSGRRATSWNNSGGMDAAQYYVGGSPRPPRGPTPTPAITPCSTRTSAPVRGSQHAQFRQYASTQGRWMSPDPYDGSYNFRNPQSLNRYSYPLNRPLSLVDPSGLNECDEDGDCASPPPPDNCDTNAGDSCDPEDGGGESSDPVYYLTVNVVVSLIDSGPPGISTTTIDPWDGFDPDYFPSPSGPLGGGGPAPNNGMPKPTFLSCTFTSKVGLSLLTTTLDAAGIVPGEGNVLHGIQFGAGIIAAGISVFGSSTDAGLSATGVGLAIADKSGASIAVHGIEIIPVVGNIVSAGATLHDVFGGEGLIANYKGCLAGTHP